MCVCVCVGGWGGGGAGAGGGVTLYFGVVMCHRDSETLTIHQSTFSYILQPYLYEIRFELFLSEMLYLDSLVSNPFSNYLF